MSATTQPSTIDGLAIRQDFPIFQQPASDGRVPLVFLDSAASSQRPAVVIDTVSDFYSRTNANIHRGVYQLSEHESARARVNEVSMSRRVQCGIYKPIGLLGSEESRIRKVLLKKFDCTNA